jgi:hypothetical protein
MVCSLKANTIRPFVVRDVPFLFQVKEIADVPHELIVGQGRAAGRADSSNIISPFNVAGGEQQKLLENTGS